MQPAGAQRLTDAPVLSSAAAGADQKQVGEVDGADQQEQQARRPASTAERGGRRDMVRVQRHDERAKAGLGHHLAFGIVCFERGILRVDLRLRLGECGARLETCNELFGIAARMPLPGARDPPGATRTESTAAPPTTGSGSPAAGRPPRCSVSPSMRSCVPMTRGSALKCWRHQASVRMATLSL